MQNIQINPLDKIYSSWMFNVAMYSSSISTKSLSFCMTTCSASLTKLTALLPQSRDRSCYISRPMPAPPPLWLQKRIDLRGHDFAHRPYLWYGTRLANFTCAGSWKLCGISPLLLYTGCPRRNVQDFGRAFLMLNYTDITQNTYIQSWTVTEIMAREFWNFDSCYSLIDYQIHIETGRNMWFL